MGMISQILGLFGSGRVREVVEVFRPNAEAADARANGRYEAALAQLAAEVAGEGRFNRFIDGLNRLPRPALAFGTIGLFVFAMASPDAFAVRVSALALVPEAMWWLLGAIVSFYFGAREIQKARVDNVSRVMGDLAAWRRAVDPSAPAEDRPAASNDPVDLAVGDDNPALRGVQFGRDR